MKSVIRKLILITLCCGSSVSLGQQQFLNFMPNAQAIGLGNSAVALARDPAASYWNPAALAFLVTDHVLININDSSQFNYIGVTKYFPPSLTLGLNVCRPGVPDVNSDWAILALGYRLAPFLAIGTNVNITKTAENVMQSSFGFGIFLKSFPVYRADAGGGVFNGSWFTSKSMKDKICLGLTIHNVPINSDKKQHEFRLAVALKPAIPGPVFHLAYQASADTFSLHPGIQIPLFKHTAIFMGAKDFKSDQFAVGATTQWGPFQLDLAYRSAEAKLHASLMIRLSDDRRTMFQKYERLGAEKAKENNSKGALSNYSKALGYEPDNVELNYLVAALKKQTRQRSQTIDSLLTAGDKFAAKGWHINAYHSYQKILELDRNNTNAQKRLKELQPRLNIYLEQLFRQGVISFNQNEIRRAQRIFEEILYVDRTHAGAAVYLAKIDSMNASAANSYFYRGLGYYRQKNLLRAQQEFRATLNLDPNHKQAREYLSRVEREIETNRRQVERLLTEARSHEQKKQYLKAHTAYRRILEIEPGHEEARRRLESMKGQIRLVVDDKFQRAKNLFLRNDNQAAIAAFKEILTIDPDHVASKSYLKRATQRIEALAEQHYQRGQNFFQQKNWDMVIQECNLALGLNPNHTAAEELHRTALANLSLDKLYARGVDYYARGDYKNARSIFKQILAKEPNNAAAQDYLKRAEKAFDDRITEIFNTGMIKYTEGDYEEAINAWNNVLKIDPHHASALEYIQKAREKLDALNRIE